MMRKMAVLSAALLLSLCQEAPIFSEQIYREMNESGKVVGRWLNLRGIRSYEYTADGTSVHWADKEDALADTYSVYDARGNRVYLEDKWYGDEYWYKYNSRGDMIYKKCSDIKVGEKYYEHEYDARGKKVCTKCSDGSEIRFEYDEGGRLIHEEYISSKKDTSNYWYEYDSEGNMVHETGPDGWGMLYDYDADGRKVHALSSDGRQGWWQYDGSGNVVRAITPGEVGNTVSGSFAANYGGRSIALGDDYAIGSGDGYTVVVHDLEYHDAAKTKLKSDKVYYYEYKK